MRIFDDLRLWLLAPCLAAGGFAGDLAADASKVTIGLQGHISPKCSLSDAAGQLSFGVLGREQSTRTAALGFTIDCNTPFTYRVSGEQGAMRLRGADDAPDATQLALPYRITLTIPTDDGGTLTAHCDSKSLSGQSCDADSGHAVAMGQRGQMLVSLTTSSGQPLEGQYTDDIQITLSVKQ